LGGAIVIAAPHAVQALSNRLGHRTGDGLTRRSRQLPGEALGFFALYIKAHEEL
jgi:hypothetical protein